MRSTSVEENKGSWLGLATPEISNGNGIIGFEFQKGANRTPNHHRSSMGKPAPSKWDDAEKWLSGVGFARGGSGGGEKTHNSRSAKPRNSNADDLRLIASASQREREGENQYVEYEEDEAAAGRPEVETKNIDCGGSGWRKDSINPAAVIRSVCVRDMGTEMTPTESQEPSRTATPVRATTPVGRSPVLSPVRASPGEAVGSATETMRETRSISSNNEKNGSGDKEKAMSALEARAMAWDEAERAKFIARYKREEVKIQAWENHEKRKAEIEMKKMEVKAARIKARAEEKMANKMAATKRIAEERRANAEAKLNEKAVRTSERADYIRRSGHLPYSLSFKLPSLCW